MFVNIVAEIKGNREEGLMKRKIKKSISLIVILALVISMNVHAQTDMDRVVNMLLNAGMSLEDIEKLPTEKLIELQESTQIRIDSTYLEVIYPTENDNSTYAMTQSKLQINELNEEEFWEQVAIEKQEVATCDNPTVTPRGLLKQTIMFADTGTQYRFDISYIADWIVSDRPYDRGTDVFGFYVKNGTRIGGLSATYRGKAHDIDHTPFVWDLTSSAQSSLNGCAVKCPLHVWATDNYMYMSYDVTADSVSQGYIYVVGQYFHQQGDFSFTPSFSISTGGISIGGSFTAQEHMVLMTPNPEARYEF